MSDYKDKENKIGDNVILVGGKPLMNYVTGVVMQFTTNGASKVVIKSRGKFMNKAIDVAEISRRKFLEDLKISVEDVKIGSESFENKEGKEVYVSMMEITLKK